MKPSVVSALPMNEILNEITSDKVRDSLLEILYFNDSTIDKTAFLKFVRKSCTPTDDAAVVDYINSLDTDQTKYAYFLIKLRDKLVDQISDDLGKRCDLFSITSIESAVFWSMYAIAVKKCIGIEKAKETLVESAYFGAVSDSLNSYQKKSHNECLKAFNMDANRFKLKDTIALRMFLHPFHSKNKALKTRKKNLHRVEKRAKKIVQVDKLARGGKSRAMFSNGKYLVPKQFADAIVKLYLNR